MMKTIIPCLLTFMLLSVGCVKDDRNGCLNPYSDGVRLDFSFTNNKQAKNLLAEKINDIHVYVFDRSSETRSGSGGLLSHIIEVDPNDLLDGKIYADIPSGRYTIVAWASNSEDMMHDGFEATHAEDIDDDGANEYLKLSQGATTLDQFRMMLTCDTLPPDTKGDIAPKVADFGDLYYASMSDIAIDRTKSQTMHFDFTLNTANLNVSVAGLQYLEPSTRAGADMPLSVFVVGKNGILEDNNAIDSSAQRMRYDPYNQSLGTNILNTSIRSMRLDIGEEDESDMLLYLQQPDADSDVITPINLIDVILATCDGAGNTIYNNQKDIDLEDEFNIDVSIAYDNLSVSVSVNGFEPVILTPEVSKPGTTPNS